MATYEFKTVKLPYGSPRAQERILNRYGRDGWQLVSMDYARGFNTKNVATLQREVPGPA